MDFESKGPIYLQISDVVCENIMTERWQEGSRIPSVRELAVEAEVSEFIQDMAAAYAWADLVVCRAGALTVSELQAAGVGAILVPYPHAVDDHQARNAEQLVRAGAAIMLRQAAMTPEVLADQLRSLLGNQERLLCMARAARGLAQADAAASVARACLEVAR